MSGRQARAAGGCAVPADALSWEVLQEITCLKGLTKACVCGPTAERTAA